jgi:pyridoxamine 5'-phosphate oxidase
VAHDFEPDLAAMRREYVRAGLAEADLAPTWLAQFHRWLGDVIAAGVPEPNAMIVATADAAGRPSARTVLLKAVDERGFVFYTNLRSRKAGEIAANPYASLVFPWHPVGRQVIVQGRAEHVDRAETEAYFATRPRDSRLGAWASPQSQVVGSRAALEEALAEVDRRFAGDASIPAPPHWGGVRVVPETVEFWQGREGRLHDRLRFRELASGTIEQGRELASGTIEHGRWKDREWVVERLAP